MAFNDFEEVVQFIKKHRQTSTWVEKAREHSRVLRALVLGEDFHKVLINQIEKIESTERAIARKKYSKDIRDVFERVNQPISSIFIASGGSVNNSMPEGVKRDKFVKSLAQFKGQKSLKKYLSEEFFSLGDVDPNGLIFVEYREDEDIFPTYKSINDIRYYRSNGQLLDVLLFEPKDITENNVSIKEWRLIDENKEWRIRERGEVFSEVEEFTFEHPFGMIPAVILSEYQETGTELRKSRLFPIEEVSKDYARDKSILTIYKFQNGFPKHGRFEAFCRSCNGVGKTGQGDKCTNCDGKGIIRKNDVTDTTILPMPIDNDAANVAPNHEWFVSPDLETWKQYKEDLVTHEESIEETQWGTKRVKEGKNETATGRFIDAQPIMNKLNVLTDNVEWADNQLARLVENWVNGEPVKESEYHETFGRRFIIESPDFILDKYNESRDKGSNNTILDKLLDEYFLSIYQTNPIMLEQIMKKRQVEPFIHMSVTEVNDIFGLIEASRKTLFVDFWEQADTTKDVDTLKTEFDKYTGNKIIKEIPPAPSFYV